MISGGLSFVKTLVSIGVVDVLCELGDMSVGWKVG